MSHRPGDASPLMARLTEAARAQDEAALALLKDRTTLDPDRVHDLRVTVKSMSARGRTTMIVRRGDAYLGALGLMDTPRPAARRVIQRLRDIGVSKMMMISG